jgi:5-(aminomethyl)-3-furanmethanol phosphate kinase
MMMTPQVILKVGGSLFDNPHFRQLLKRYVTTVATPVVIVPGGGDLADAIRKLDAIHRIGEEDAHWLAVRTLSITARLISQLLDDIPIIEGLEREYPRISVLDAEPFLLADRKSTGEIPHNWSVSSDAIAGRFAELSGATELRLVKSCPAPSDDWETCADLGFIDPVLPGLLKRSKMKCVAVQLSDTSILFGASEFED